MDKKSSRRMTDKRLRQYVKQHEESEFIVELLQALVVERRINRELELRIDQLEWSRADLELRLHQELGKNG